MEHMQYTLDNLWNIDSKEKIGIFKTTLIGLKSILVKSFLNFEAQASCFIYNFILFYDFKA